MTGLVVAAILVATGQTSQGLDGVGPFLSPNLDGDWQWISAPLRDGPMTVEDARAREALSELIEENQYPAFRETYSVSLPEKPTGLPDEYDILMYGKYITLLRMRMEIHVRSGRVTAELVTADGFYRGPLPKKAIDHLTRQLVYAFIAEHKARPESEPRWRGANSSSFFRSQRIELEAYNVFEGFHLRTEAWRLDAHRIGVENGIPAFMHTRFAMEVEKLARERLKLLKPNDELRRELVTRLQRIQPNSPNSDSNREECRLLSDVVRDDLASVEAMLYARLAVYWQLEEALPELQRLGLKAAALRLAIVTADDPTELLKEAISITFDDVRSWQEVDNEQYTDDIWLFDWSMDYLSRLPEAKQVEILLDAMPRVMDGYSARDVLRRLEDSQLGPTQLAKVDSFYSETTDPRARIGAARCLLNHTNQDEYYQFLLGQARKWPESAELTGYPETPEYDALRALMTYFVKQGKNHHEVVEMVRSLIEQVPDDTLHRLSFVALRDELERKEDVELLAKYCAHEDPFLARTAIMALARIKPDLALEKARQEIDDYTEGKRQFYDGVYLELLFWQNDRSAVKSLEAALAKCRQETERDGWKWESVSDDLQLLVIGYLKADTIEERTKYAVEYAQLVLPDSQSHEWFKEIGTQLVRDGADPEECRPLLAPHTLFREHQEWDSHWPWVDVTRVPFEGK